MKLRAWRSSLSGVGVFIAGLAGCMPPPPQDVTIELYNPTSRDVRPNLHVSATAGNTTELFTVPNRFEDFTDRPFPELRPGETVTIVLPCDQIRGVGVDMPVMFDGASLDVDTATERLAAFRDAAFECGDRLRFTFFTEGDRFTATIEFP